MGSKASKKSKEQIKQEKIEQKRKEKMAKLYPKKKKVLLANKIKFKPNSIMKKDSKIKEHYKICGFESNAFINIDIKSAVHIKSGEKRSVKIINKNYMTPLEKKETVYKMELLRHIEHPHIGRIHEFLESAHYYYFVLDHINGKDLLTKISQKKSGINEKQIRDIARSLLSAISYLHYEEIYHGNLSSSSMTYENDWVKIVDFPTLTDKTKIIENSFEKGSGVYLAPEVINMEEDNKKADEWSVGVLLYILLSGEAPFKGKDDELKENIINGNFAIPIKDLPDITKRSKAVLTALLTVDPTERKKAKEILQMGWFDVKRDTADEIEDLNKMIRTVKKFQFNNKLQEAIFIYMAQEYTREDQKKMMMEDFRIIDKNKDGVITRNELMKHFYELEYNYTPKEMNVIFDMMDVDGDNQVTFKEFVATSLNHQRSLNQKNILETFRVFDKNNNGMICVDELLNILDANNKWSDSEFKEMLKELDSDGNNFIDFKEFEHLVNEMSKKFN